MSVVNDESIIADQIKERLKLLEEASFEAITVFDENLICIDANNQTSRLFQYDREEILGMKGIDFFTAEWRHQIPKIVAARINKPYEARMLRKDGSVFWGLIQGTSIDVGNKTFRVSTCRDIDEYKEIESRYKQQGEEYETIFENSLIGVLLLDKHRRVVRANSQLATIFGYESSEDLIGESTKIFHLSEESFINFIKYYNEDIYKGKQLKLDYCFRKRDGSAVWMSVSGKLVKHSDSEELSKSIVWVFEDISQRKKYELELRESNEELSSLNHELKKLNRSKDEFISILAHDLKSPMGTLSGLTDLIVEDFDSYDREELKYQLNLIRKNLGKTYSMLDDILIWIKSQLGRVEYHMQDFDFFEFASELVRQTEPQAAEKNITLGIVNKGKVSMRADIEMMKIVVRNLLSNAIKFTHPGGKVILKVSTENERVYISVIDNGIGIEPENISKIWEVSRGHTKTGTNGEIGTGFGLQLCKEFISKMGGAIKVESEVGKGSEFVISLPAV